jgi:hypothetical protein
MVAMRCLRTTMTASPFFTDPGRFAKATVGRVQIRHRLFRAVSTHLKCFIETRIEFNRTPVMQIIKLFHIFAVSCMISAQDVVLDQKTLIEPIRDNSIALLNNESDHEIVIEINFVTEVDVLFGFALRSSESLQEDVLRKAVAEAKVTRVGESENVRFAIPHKQILNEFPSAAGISTKSKKQSVFEGGKYPLKLNVANRICEVFDSSGKSLGVLELVVGERIKGEILMNYLIDGKLAPVK